MHRLHSNLAYSNGFSCEVDTERSLFKKLSGGCNKLWHLLQKILFCGILQQSENFCERNLSESIQNTKLPLHTKFGK